MGIDHLKDIELISNLYHKAFGTQPTEITPLTAAGSNRRYYIVGRIIATCGDDLIENRAFIYLARHFRSAGLPVPEIIAVSDCGLCYFQSKNGSSAVFDRIAQGRATGQFSPAETELLERSIRLLPHFQFTGAKGIDPEVLYPRKAMDSRMTRWDLNYFKYSFLKPSGIEFDEDRLQDDFDALESILLDDPQPYTTFMLRDFQSRNVMVDDNAESRLTVIDFQGGRFGPPQYDVASFLWQSKAAIPEQLKQQLIECYIDEATLIKPDFDSARFCLRLPYFVLFRILQTLGAYGFRGWVERKPHFLASVPAGADNFAKQMSISSLKEKFHYLYLLSQIIRDKFGSKTKYQQEKLYTHHINPEDDKLTVSVTSFSFKKGIPEDKSGNGGGFVFDCRAPHNPGRYEPYKNLTGLDRPVREFLEQDGEILPFIQECKRLVDASVERYLQRGFTSLSVCFGCTGGQHRSVYSADAVARHLNEKYGIRVKLLHREQGISEELSPRPTKVIFDSFLRDPQKQPRLLD